MQNRPKDFRNAKMTQFRRIISFVSPSKKYKTQKWQVVSKINTNLSFFISASSYTLSYFYFCSILSHNNTANLPYFSPSFRFLWHKLLKKQVDVSYSTNCKIIKWHILYLYRSNVSFLYYRISSGSALNFTGSDFCKTSGSAKQSRQSRSNKAELIKSTPNTGLIKQSR